MQDIRLDKIEDYNIPLDENQYSFEFIETNHVIVLNYSANEITVGITDKANENRNL